MSLYGALYAGVAGLQAQSNKLGIISDNVANVNTIGYKQGVALFETLVTSASNATAYSPGGVLGANQQLISTQGLLQTTSSPTDIAISGGGFFVVNQTFDGSGQVLYTRAGSFSQDAQGNFKNASGFFLQAWPLDRDGRLPGEPGNLNTVSNANLSSLQTVNVQNLTGTAAATTAVSLGANLNASQAAFSGAGGTAILDSLDTANFGIRASDIIIPTAVDSIVRGDTFTIASGAGLSYSFTYDGFTFGRNVVNAANGDSGVALQTATSALTTVQTHLANSITTGAAGANTVLTITVPSTADLITGQYITIAGEAATIDGVLPAQINGIHQITVINGTQYSFTSTGTATAGATTGGTAGITTTPNPFTTTNTSNTVTVTDVTHGLATGAVVTYAGISGAVNGIPAAELNSSFVVTVLDANRYTITTPTTAATSTNGGGAGTIIATHRPFAGNILDAINQTQSFLGTTGTSSFTSTGLTFTITTAASGTVTFTYTGTAPNSQLKQFNNLNNLAEAIGDVTGLTARVVNGRLYVGATDPNAAVTFANGSVVGSSGPPVQAGIDWVRELGLLDVATGSSRFSSLQSLADAVNLSTGLSATVENPLGAASAAITVDNPLDTITFTDGVANTGSLLAALGLVDSLNSGAYSQQTTGALGPAYDPSNSDTNMASGAIPPQFSRPVTIFDALGSAHNLNVAFLKTDANSWVVEVYAQPETDVNSSLPDGQVANGTITFNGDGSLRSVSTSLTSELNINWTNGAVASTVSLNWGTAGQPFGTPNAAAIGKTDGLSQFDSGYNVTFVDQNGAPVGQLVGIAIDQDGFIIASYNNGETQKLYKIPLASFTDPNHLQSVSGNAYSQTNGSGEVNLKQAGQSGVGNISSGAVEASNVELANELTNMIVAQRAYQANTKVISTADSLLNDLDQILR